LNRPKLNACPRKGGSVEGSCSKCHRIWKLETEQGLCQWCGNVGSCQTTRTKALRTLKSSRRRNRRQPEPRSNGYDQLEGIWLTYYKVASRFASKALPQDRDDLLHEIILTLALVERNNGHKPFTELAMYRIASHRVADYWREHYRVTNGCDCGHCSQSQRAACLKEWLEKDHGNLKCAKAMRMETLSKPIVDSEGNTTELGELIADDKALDLDAWLDVKTFLRGCPQRLIAIAEKTNEGQSLTNRERQYLWYFRQKEQKVLSLS
jgi:DNA-directed RNA polymerase specialized sigma24 family protein